MAQQTREDRPTLAEVVREADSILEKGGYQPTRAINPDAAPKGDPLLRQFAQQQAAAQSQPQPVPAITSEREA